MRLVPAIGWRLEGDSSEPVDERLLPLLAAIAATASLAAAVTECGISYRAAWGLLRDYRRKLGIPLVTLERGRGAHLTPAGQTFLRAQETAGHRLARLLPGLVAELGPESVSAPRARPLRLRVAASHDLALAALAETLPGAGGVELELYVTGSLYALREFAEGRADAAGFHVPLAARAASERAPFLRWLRARRDRLIRVVDREQGLILPPGNPAHVKSLRDVAARKLRFVNRQRGSGTRLLIDRMLADENIEGSALEGFGNEEFTHPAVAATVASGGADAGFGLRAAAAEYRLAFVPLVRERYFLAVRAKDLDKPPLARLIDALRSAAFGRLVRRLPGYRSTAAGSTGDLAWLEPSPRASSRPT